MSICDRCLKNNPIEQIFHTCEPKGVWKKGIDEGYQKAIDDSIQLLQQLKLRMGTFMENTAQIVGAHSVLNILNQELKDLKKGKSDE